MTTTTKLERQFSLRKQEVAQCAQVLERNITSAFISASGGELTGQSIEALNIILMLSAKKYDAKTELQLKMKLSALLGFDV